MYPERRYYSAAHIEIVAVQIHSGRARFRVSNRHRHRAKSKAGRDLIGFYVGSIGIAYGAVHLQQLGGGPAHQPRVAFAGGWLLEAVLELMHAAGTSCGIFTDSSVAEGASSSCGVAAQRVVGSSLAGQIETWQLHQVEMPSFVNQKFEQPSVRAPVRALPACADSHE